MSIIQFNIGQFFINENSVNRTLIIDHFAESGRDISKPGGIYYTILGVNLIREEKDEIYLLTGISENSFDLFRNGYGNINLSLSKSALEMPEVTLTTSGSGERKEVYKNLASRIQTDLVLNWNEFDGILINMITGLDISLMQLKEIRRQFKGKIYLDVHTLSRGIDASLNREFRPIPDIGEWLKNIDILQCNEAELSTVIEKGDLHERAEYILNSGPKIFVLTKAGEGASVYFKSGGDYKSLSEEGETVKIISKVGCGDVFGAVFFYSYISGADISHALKLANKAGALAVSELDLQNKKIMKND